MCLALVASTQAGSAAFVPAASHLPLSAVVVHPADLPSDWSSQPGGPSPTQAADSAAFARCVGVTDTNPDVVGAAYSPIFSLGAETITSSVSRFRHAADVASDSAAIANPKAASCLARIVRPHLVASLPSGATLKKFSLQIVLGPGAGPSNLAATTYVTATVTSAGAQTTVFDTTAIVTGNRVEAQVSFASLGNQVPARLQAGLIAKVAKRAMLA